MDELYEDPDDIARSFYSTFFNNLTELIDSIMQQYRMPNSSFPK